MLSPIQKDVLTEILNIQLGLAAKALSEMLNQKIFLSIPCVECIESSNNNNISNVLNLNLFHNPNLIAQISFGQEFSGRAYLALPMDHAKALSHLCMGVDLPHQPVALNEDDLDIFKEVSNVIFNMLIGEFGNMLNKKLDYSVPGVMIVDENNDKNLILPSDMNILVMQTKFSVANNQLSGTIFITLVSESISLLFDKVNQMIGDLYA